MADFIIRRANRNDLPTIMNHENLCFGCEAWSLRMLSDEIDNPLSFFRVAEETGENPRLVGYILAWLIAPLECQIGSICVHPEKQRHGIGGALLDELFEACRELWIDEVSLEVKVGNTPAIELYEKHGFKINGIRKEYYKDGSDAYTMIYTGLSPLNNECTEGFEASAEYGETADEYREVQAEE